MPSPPRPWQIITLLGLGILAVSSASILIRLALGWVAPAQHLTLSFVLAAARLGVAAIVLIPSWRGFSPATYHPHALGYGVLAGICLALHFAAWIPSLALTSIAASTALVTTNPIWVVLIQWLWRGNRPSSKQSAGIAVALLGGLWIGFADGRAFSLVFSGEQPLLGDALALVGSWAVSVYLLCGERAQQLGLSLRHYIVLAYSIAALCLLPILMRSPLGQYPWPVYGYMVLLAIFPQLLGHTSLNWALRWLSPVAVTLVILAEPIGSSLLGWWIFQEVPSPQVLWGGLLLLMGVVLTTAPESKNNS